MVLNIAEEFGTYPVGRVVADGSFNGTAFRQTLLKPRLEEAQKSGEPLVVSLNGLKSFGSSFFEEAFGGLMRELGRGARAAAEVIVIDPGIPANERWKRIIEGHIEAALKAQG